MIAPTIIPTFHLNGYNLSIIEHEGKRYQSYRYHPNSKQWRTKISIQQENKGCNIERNLLLPGIYADMSHEDGRLFIFQGKLHISLTVSAFPDTPGVMVPCATGYGELELDGANWVIRDFKLPKIGRNNFETQEKNHVMFEYCGQLNVIYQCSPNQLIYRLMDDGVIQHYIWDAPSPSWPYGDIRGGTQPLPYKGKWLRFFHSLYKQGKNRADWTYAIGALVMNPEPPFQIEAISKTPVFSGDERFVPGWQYFKQNVSIPYGAIPQDGGWLVAVGLNDSYCATFHVQEKDLNL